jgi:two-component system nitrogen regulation response regulator NtrX
MTPVRASRRFLRSGAIKAALQGLQQAIGSNGGVLLYGEPGTGRELVARAIHVAAHTRHEGSLDQLMHHCWTNGANGGPPFVVVDCRSLPNVEAAIFGTPTDAGRRHAADHDGLDRIAPGSRIHGARGGTLFLRALQEMPSRVQVRLARLLRDGEALVAADDGGDIRAPICVRVMAAIDPVAGTSTDEQVVAILHQRLSAHRIVVPPLRHRREDIPPLIRTVLDQVCASSGIPPRTLSAQAMALMSALPWRGNLDELKDLTRIMALNVSSPVIQVSDVLAHVRLDGASPAFAGGGTLREARAQFEREYVRAVLERHAGRMAEAARVLGIERANLYRKVRQLSVVRPRNGRS